MKHSLIRTFLASPLLAFALTASPIHFRANLDGPSEAPPNASPGTGYALVGIDAVAHTMSVWVSFSNLAGLTTAAHIHGIADTGQQTGPVATTTPTFAGFPLGVSAGSYSTTLDTLDTGSYRAGWISDNGGTAASAEAALFAAIVDGRAYFNIHSTEFPGGEIRGFLQPVPEPATWGLSGLLLAGLALKRRTSGSSSR